MSTRSKFLINLKTMLSLLKGTYSKLRCLISFIKLEEQYLILKSNDIKKIIEMIDSTYILLVI